MALRQKTTLIVIHVTATPPSADIGVKEVDRMHRNRGWKGCGYHFVIRRNGNVEKGRPVHQVGAHVQGFNSVSVGVSLVGGVDEQGKPEDNRTGAQEAALRKLIFELLVKFPNARVCGHRDLSPDRDRDGVIEPHEYLKACPCFDAIPWAEQNGFAGANIAGTWSKRNPTPAGPDDRTVYLQKLLKRAGYEFGPIDGIVGPRTQAALKRFQKAANLDASGQFDAATVKRLRDMYEAGRPKPITVVEQKQVPVTPEQAEKPGNDILTTVGSGLSLVVSSFTNLDWRVQLALIGVGVAGLGYAAYRRLSLAKTTKRIREALS